MFEKEAEEFVDSKKSFWRQGRTCIDSVRQAYQKGVEFGYNKAKEEINQNGLSLQSDMDKTIEQNVALKKENLNLKAKIEEIKRDIIKCFGYEYNILVAKLLNKWEIKENE